MKRNGMDTKHRILDEALTLISKKGYANVFVADIAERVGIKAPSLYKHYKNKQAIFDAIIEEMNRRFLEEAGALQINGANAVEDAEIYKHLSEEQLITLGNNLFLYFLHDDYTRRFRKMLTIEQFHDRDNAEITEYYLPKDGPGFCTGYTACFRNNQNLCKDAEKVQKIERSLLEADLLVFTSPAYVFHTTGAMKAIGHLRKTEELRSMEALFEKVTLTHVPRTENKRADMVGRKEALFHANPKVIEEMMKTEAIVADIASRCELLLRDFFSFSDVLYLCGKALCDIRRGIPTDIHDKTSNCYYNSKNTTKSQ